MKTSPKAKPVDTTNLQPGELIHLYLAFYNLTSISGFNSILTVVYAKTVMLWLFPTASKDVVQPNMPPSISFSGT